jgi:hypothetical protein
MPKRTTPQRKPPKRSTRTRHLSAAAVRALGPLVLEAELSPDDWSDLQAAEGETPRVPSFRMVAYRGGVMRPRMMATYGEGVVVDLATARVVSGQLPIHYVHDTSDPVGHAETVELSNTVTITGKLSVPGPSRDKIVGGAVNGFRWRPSISARNFELERLLPEQTATVNGRRIRGPVLIARRAEIYETSFLSVAGDPTATASVTASHASDSEPQQMTFEQFLTACGLSADTITDDQRETLEAAYNAQYGEAGDNPETPATPSTPSGNPVADHLQAMRAEAAIETRRQSRIRQLCVGDALTIDVAGQPTDLCAHAIETNMDPRDVELHILRAGRARGPAIHSRTSDETQNVAAMTAAVLLASGIPLDHPAMSSPQARYAGVPAFLRASINDDNRQRVMEAGHRYGSVNLMDLAGDAIELDTGQRVRGRENRIQAAASSGSLSTIYAHTVGAALLVGFLEAPSTVGQFSSQEFVNDFKQVQRFNEDAESSLELLEANGEAAHATAGVKFEYLKADIYARQFEIDRYAYTNNDLGLIGRKPRRMGGAARRLEEDFVYSVILSNPTMLTTGRALFNATDGTLHASHALTNANGSKAVAYMMNRMQGDQTLDLRVGHALVPTELHDLSKRIFTSQFVDSAEGTANPLRDHGVMTVASPRLSNGVTHPKTKVFAAGSSTTWYTIARDIEVAVRVYLQETGGVPQVRVTPLTQGKFGTHMDVSYDYGFGFVTPYGADKFTA